jgi:3-hydroxybutyryl-CoA dehydratase
MSQTKELIFDDMVQGRSFPSVDYTLDPQQVREYAAAVGDLNPLYVDEEFARCSKYGGPIAPPTIAAVFTTLRVVLKEQKMPPGAIHAKQYFKFIKPVRPGDKLHITVTLKDKYIRRDRKWVVIETQVENQHGEDVVLARITGIWPK